MYWRAWAWVSFLGFQAASSRFRCSSYSLRHGLIVPCGLAHDLRVGLKNLVVVVGRQLLLRIADQDEEFLPGWVGLLLDHGIQVFQILFESRLLFSEHVQSQLHVLQEPGSATFCSPPTVEGYASRRYARRFLA